MTRPRVKPRPAVGVRSSYYYGPHPTGHRGRCPDCGRDCDADFGDHGGDCLIERPGARKAT